MTKQHRMSAPELGERSKAPAAGVYDWCLGGRHHLPCDADAAIAAQRLFPLAARTARYNRDFMQQAVRWLISRGIRRFLDIGSGHPAAGNVHEIAQRYGRGARVVYVDLDPDTVEVSAKILAGDPDTVCLQGDLCDPASILDHPRLGLLDFTQPIALLLVSVLPFVHGDAGPLVHPRRPRFSSAAWPAFPDGQKARS